MQILVSEKALQSLFFITKRQNKITRRLSKYLIYSDIFLLVNKVSSRTGIYNLSKNALLYTLTFLKHMAWSKIRRGRDYRHVYD